MPNRLKVIIRLYPYLLANNWSARLRFISAISLLVATSTFNICLPLVLKQIIATIVVHPAPLLFAHVSLISYGFIWTFSKVTEQLRFIVMNRVIERGIHLLCLAIFDHLLALSLRFHTERKTGAILSAIDRVRFSFPGLVWGIFFLILPTLTEIIIAALILIYLYDLMYGIILITILITYMLISILGNIWSMHAQRIANQKTILVNTNIVDSLLNYETIRHFDKFQHEHHRCNTLLANQEEASINQHLRSQLVLLLQGLLMGTGLTILTYISGRAVMADTLKVSDFVLINVYLMQLMVPLGNFGYVLRDINQGLTNLEDAIQLLDEKPDIQNAPNAINLQVKQGIIHFNHVNFSYDLRRPILHRLSFVIPAKKTVALIGPTGSGKSTIAKLLMRHYDLLAGQITIDDQDIRCVTQSSLQKIIAIVPQHTPLFNNTLRYNITYARPDVSDNEIKECIERTKLDLLIKSLPDGLDTIVGEHGLKLSGGEKQRVAIARAILKKPSIYIFDEATASLDTKTERSIQQNIQEISHNTTTIIIAHRLSTIIHADHILVLDQGTLVEEGNHDNLLKMRGLYARLWFKQTNPSQSDRVH